MKNTSTKDRKEYFKIYREQNKEKIAEKNKKYQEENKEKIAKYQREYYQENKERIRNKYNNICNMDCFNCIYDDCIMP